MGYVKQGTTPVMVQHAASVIRAGREGQLIWHETWDMNEVLSGARIISSSPRSATDFNLSDCLGGRRILTEQYPTLAEVNGPGLSARQEQTSLLLGQLRASPHERDSDRILRIRNSLLVSSSVPRLGID